MTNLNGTDFYNGIFDLEDKIKSSSHVYDLGDGGDFVEVDGALQEASCRAPSTSTKSPPSPKS